MQPCSRMNSYVKSCDVTYMQTVDLTTEGIDTLPVEVSLESGGSPLSRALA